MQKARAARLIKQKKQNRHNMRYAARADDNQVEIVNACRQVGAVVESLHRCGKGVPDLLIGWHGNNLLFEVKDGNKSASKRRLTSDQEDWHSKWKGKIYTVTSVEEALNILAKERC